MMKRNFIMWLVVLIICNIALFSCSKEPIYDDQGHSSGSSAIYKDIFYVSTKNKSYTYNINCYSLTNTQSSSLYACSDVLCTHNTVECPTYMKTNLNSIAIDVPESDNNDYCAVIYMSDLNKINKFDSKNNKARLIKEYNDGTIVSFWLYNDWIYFVFNYKNELQLRRIDKSGKNELIAERENNDISFRILGFDENYLYYMDFLSNYYRIDLDLKCEEFLFSTTCFVNGIIHNGYLYYCNDLTSESHGDMNFEICALYRTKLDMLFTDDCSHEFIMDNILVSVTPMVFYSNGNIFYNLCNPQKIGENKLSDESGSEYIYPIWLSGSSTMYILDTDTLKGGVVYEDIGYDLSRFYYADENIVLIRGLEYYQDTNDLWYSKSLTLMFDIKSGKTVEIAVTE